MNLKSLTLILSLSLSATSVLAGLGSTSSEFSGSTSGSTKKIFSQNEKERAQQFVQQNYDQLQEQAARGSGVLLTDYVRLMGCESSQKTMTQMIQKNYTDLFSGGQSELLPRTEKLIQQESSLVQSCDLRV